MHYKRAYQPHNAADRFGGYRFTMPNHEFGFSVTSALTEAQNDPHR